MATPAGRQGILSLTIKDKSALYAAYMPFVKGGGLFIPTKKSYRIGEEVFMLLTLMEETEKIPVAGKIIWITPVGAQGNRAAGIGVQFSDQDQGNTQKKIEAFGVKWWKARPKTKFEEWDEAKRAALLREANDFGPIEDMKVGRRDIRVAQHFLAEDLAAFQLSGGFGRSEYAQLLRLECVGNRQGLDIRTEFEHKIAAGRREGWSNADSLYYGFITATTVGYGDMTPATGLGKVYAIILAMIGLVFTGIMVALAVEAAGTVFDQLHG